MNGHSIDIEITVRLFGGWHIGSGMTSGLTDRGVLRNGLGEPYIPGATLKGAIRQSCENIAEALGLEVSDPHDTSGSEGFCGARETAFVIDRLFGSRYDGECLYFRNAQLVDTYSRALHTSAVTRTRIDRVTGAVKDKHLFSTEYIEALPLQSKITGYHRYLVAEDSDSFPVEYALLIAGIKNVSRLGGSKSVGKGHVTIDVGAVRWNGNDVGLGDALAIFKEREFKDYYTILAGEALNG